MPNGVDTRPHKHTQGRCIESVDTKKGHTCKKKVRGKAAVGAGLRADNGDSALFFYPQQPGGPCPAGGGWPDKSPQHECNSTEKWPCSKQSDACCLPHLTNCAFCRSKRLGTKAAVVACGGRIHDQQESQPEQQRRTVPPPACRSKESKTSQDRQGAARRVPQSDQSTDLLPQDLDAI